MTVKRIQVLRVEEDPGDVEPVPAALAEGTLPLEVSVVTDGIDARACLREPGQHTARHASHRETLVQDREGSATHRRMTELP